MSTKVKTQADAINDVRNAIIEFETTGAINEALVSNVNFTTRDIQVRDFLMGITTENHSAELVANFITYLSTSAKDDEIAPLNAVLASYRYRLGDTTGAIECLNKATEATPDYSLAVLLNRVIGSGWAPSAFALMSEQLHPKVVAGIEEGNELEIA
jgi:hypothetical protein